MAHRTIQLQNDRRPSTRNLLPNWAFTLERVTGIEPALSVGKSQPVLVDHLRGH
jgi:hypothetical protein